MWGEKSLGSNGRQRERIQVLVAAELKLCRYCVLDDDVLIKSPEIHPDGQHREIGKVVLSEW